tara:strand:- start:98 stop:358 length:261 start_codon:yes stop_codon:yes gene_type:complete
MNLFKYWVVFSIILISCNTDLKPEEAALQTCECMKLSKDTSELGIQAFTDCNNKTKEMMAPYREDTKWMSDWKESLMEILKECMTE